ncbi:MAG: hypothetical protein MZW92_42115 [Comamonadaceae bacterium]|nr:hypothetical protein [Comamonadaceae bacterium]
MLWITGMLPLLLAGARRASSWKLGGAQRLAAQPARGRCSAPSVVLVLALWVSRGARGRGCCKGADRQPRRCARWRPTRCARCCCSSA